MGIVIVSLITYFNPVSDGNVVDISNLTLELAIYIFVSAMITISAMVLPGISGSTLLLIFGLYIPIINAIKELIHFNLSYFPVLFIFGLGVLTGIVLVIRLIKTALEKYQSQTVYLILGLMIGSLYAIVMGLSQAALSFPTFDIICFIVDGAIIFGLEKIK